MCDVHPPRAMLRRIVVFLFSLVITGCATLSVSNLPGNEQELGVSSTGEGVVVGSVLLTVEEEDSEHSYYVDDTSPLGLKGMKTAGRNFVLWAKLKSSGWSQYKFAVVAKPGEEAFCIKRLPAGIYEVYALSPEGFSPEQNRSHMPLHKTFIVYPQQTTYIGRLAIELPNRFGGVLYETGGGSGSGIWDAEAETMAKLRDNFPAVLSNVTKRLAVQSNFPFNEVINSDCIKVNRMLFKQQGKGADADTAATQFCANVVQECINRPRGEECRRLVQNYDLKREGSGTSLIMEVAGSRRPDEATGNILLMRYLLDIGFSPNARVGSSFSEVLMPFIAPGYATRSTGNNWHDLTPLMIATHARDLKMVQMLLRAGADPNTRNDQGQTALSIAKSQGGSEIVKALNEHSPW